MTDRHDRLWKDRSGNLLRCSISRIVRYRREERMRRNDLPRRVQSFDWTVALGSSHASEVRSTILCLRRKLNLL